MEVGMIDVDGHHFPNLALMKISAYEKQCGNHVEWWNGLKHYGRVYEAKVFDKTYTKDNQFVIMADEVIKGGTGYGLDNKLPDEIEHIYPDYSLYGITDTAYGFLSRGCPRHCPFCIVGDKEGTKSRKVADIGEFWRGQGHVEILDPNLLACSERGELLDELINTNATINFNQGLDVRLLTKGTAEQINKIKTDRLHFAWDNYDHGYTRKKLEKAREWLDKDRWHTIVYVLVNYNTTIGQDIYRVRTLDNIGYEPFVMVYDKPNASQEIKHFQRWVNNKRLFRSCSWEEYKQ